MTLLLTQAIARHGGRIRFDQFMDIAMFAPGRGYYDSVNRIFGDDGDFTTAPEISSFFGQCIARQILQIMAEMGQVNILEFGAGSGILAQTILMELEKNDRLPQTYFIYDISPTLRERQYARLKDNVPHLIDKLVWLNDIPEHFNGIIIANEVLDAMPVHRVVFRRNLHHEETYVTIKNGKLVLEEGPLSSIKIKREMDKIMQVWPDIKDGYRSEISLGLKHWIARISQILGKGLVLLIDYGFTRREYYQPIHHQGNLMCYFQHRAHDDPLLYPGIQDVTCHVDFSHVAEAFQDQGLAVAGYTNQAFFLAGCGLEVLYQELDTSDEEKFIDKTRCLEKLIMPNAMGESFKVIGLTRGLNEDLIGFSVSNQKDRL
ncbi:MAG: SAM-dependent methyltransferase [Proteobacteria bacterium]|nr:SAM-dependent methyltransferase [Pseudomonadota bacterium]